MFNIDLRKEALKIHESTVKKYNDSYETMSKLCEQLYSARSESVKLVKRVQSVVNSIANTPKEFDAKLGNIGKELTQFNETEEYAKEAYDASVKAGVNIAAGAFGGMSVASITPTVMTQFATTFGTASTGTAISALSGAAAEKAAIAYLGRTFAGFAVKEGAGMAAGKAFLALAGPMGWGITAATTGLSLISLSNKNKKIADKAVDEAKEMEKLRESLDETTERIRTLKAKTDLLYNDMDEQRTQIMGFQNAEYNYLSDADKYFLGSLVNNTLTLSKLLNENVQ